MSTITTRSGKGALLTNNEIDANFVNLNTDKVETSAVGTAAALDTGTVDGSIPIIGADNLLPASILPPPTSTLASLTDVFTSMSPTEGQVLTYDATNGWQSEDTAGNLQDTYEASTASPEITTNASKGALSIRRGSALDTDLVLAIQAGDGANKFTVNGNGDTTISGAVTATGGIDALTTATTAVVISASAAPTANQVLTAIDGTSASWQNQVAGYGGKEFIATSDGVKTVFSASDFTPSNFNYNIATRTIKIYVNGMRADDSDFTETSSDVVTFTSPPASGSIKIEVFEVVILSAQTTSTEFIATGNGVKTTFSASDFAPAAGFNYGGVNDALTIYYDGVLRPRSEYILSSDTSVTFNNPPINGVEILALVSTVLPFPSATPGLVQNFVYTATAGQTVFVGNDDNSLLLQFSSSTSIQVFLNGVKLSKTTDFTSDAAADSITLTTGATLNDVFEVSSYSVFESSDTYTQAQIDAKDTLVSNVANAALPKAGGTMAGNITTAGISSVTAGTGNFVAGAGAGDSIVAGGNNNTLIGDGAGTAITTGDNNTASGFRALYTNTTGSNNTAVGYNAGDAITTGARNTFIGSESGGLLTTGTQNTAIGESALASGTTSNNNVAIGFQSLYATTTGFHNTAVGTSSIGSNTTGYNNTASGQSALYSNTTGYSNTASGTEALYSNTTGYNNIASGKSALYSNTTGVNNTASGQDALQTNTTGNNNTASGLQSLHSNTTGSSNTAIGLNALYSNTTAANNTASGQNALYSNTTGTSNTASGRDALYSNTTGYNNIASGFRALYLNTTGYNNAACGVNALYNNTTGSGNTASGRSALYSNTTGSNNTASGQNALFSNTTGVNNVASGQSALYSNTTGYNNTASGYTSLYNNTTGYSNTASGVNALYNNTTGHSNTASGLNALYSNTTGVNNTASGRSALYSNTTGVNNTASGYTSLYNNTTGHSNTASGQGAHYSNTTGHSNTASGLNALYSNTTGHSNTASGKSSLYNNTTGSGNTASGLNALTSNTTGSGNTAINPLNSAGSYAPVFNPIISNNRFCMGSTGVTNAYIQVAWTVVSDARDKTNFAPVPHGLEFVKALQPTAYQFRIARDSEETNGGVRYGFKAQDVLELEGANPVIVDNEDEDKLRMVDTALIPVLVKALQELNAKFDAYVLTHP